MKNIETAKRLREAMHEKGMIAETLSAASGVSKSSISQYLSGLHAPSNISAGKMAEILNVNPVWLMGFDVPKRSHISQNMHDTQSSSVRIPVLGHVAAGIPINAIEEIIDYEEIPDEMARTGEYFGLQIKGDSMEPRIVNGDVVIVRRQDYANDGDLVIALVNGGEGCCKRIKKYADGSIALISTNPAYPPMYFTATEQAETPVTILGKVKELRGKF